MKHFSLLIAFSILLSACGQGSVSSAPSATPSETFVPPPSATATETPLPTATITPTLSLDPMIYQFDSNVSPEDQALVRQGVQMARYYLIQNFGSDITKNYLIKVIDNPNDKRPEGHTDIVDGQEVFTENMGHPYCKENYPERCLFSVTFEVTHLWQSEQGKLFSGCLYTTEDDPVYGFLVEGQSRYVANMLVKNGEELIDANALGYWMRAQFNDRNWLNGTEADGIAVKHLIEHYGPAAFTNYCISVGNGMSHKDAFETAFGITLDDFLNEFKEEVLGQTKDCTVAKCGGGSVIGQFKMQDWVDPKVTTPNLVANFVDEQGRPVVISNLILAKQGADGSGANRETQYSLPGKFSINIFPGSYGFYFCEPGYPSGENTGACHAYETDWFNVSENQTANMTLQLPPYIDDANLKTPDIALKFTDENGNLLPNLRLQVCNVDTPVKVCSPQYQGKETDSNGVYQDSLRSGKYLVRFNWPNVGFAREWTYTFEIDNVNITENQVTNISYKFPAPNLIVKLTDLVGGPVPNHFLVLCTADHQLGNCANVIDSPNPWSGGSYTDKQGIFKAVVKPGTYFILTGKFPTVLPVPADYTFANINVASATETTTVEFQLK